MLVSSSFSVLPFFFFCFFLFFFCSPLTMFHFFFFFFNDTATTEIYTLSLHDALPILDEHRPVHVSIIGGEPLVRHRELGQILPRLADRGVYTQVVTSAVRPIPLEWAALQIGRAHV